MKIDLLAYNQKLIKFCFCQRNLWSLYFVLYYISLKKCPCVAHDIVPLVYSKYILINSVLVFEVSLIKNLFALLRLPVLVD